MTVDEQGFTVIGNAEAWECAKKVVRQGEKYAPAFYSCIRFLMKNAEANKRTGSTDYESAGTFLVRRFLRCPSVMAPMYYATLTYHEDKIKDKDAIVAEDIMACYPPDVMASLLFTIYVSGHLRRKTDPEEWERLSKKLQNYAELGMHFGYSIPALGAARGLILGVVRQLSFALFLLVDPDEFKGYRRKLITLKAPYDSEQEIMRWGCASYQVAALLSQRLGLGTECAEALMFLATEVKKGVETHTDTHLMRIALQWLDSIILTGEPPEAEEGDEYFITDEMVEALYTVITDLQEHGTKHNWLNKRSSDISKATHPQLYCDGGVHEVGLRRLKTRSRDNQEECINYDELSEDFQQHFPKEEFEELSAEIKDLLQS